MFSIKKRFDFSASHSLLDLPEDHPCTRLHGHNYQVIVELRSVGLKESGFVLDYHDLDIIKKDLDVHYDHKHLNDCFPFSPTAENMAMYFFRDWLPWFGELLYSVTVKETEKTEATYYGNKFD